MKKAQKEHVYTLETARRIEGVRVGRIVGTDGNGQFLVDFPDNRHGEVGARLTSSVNVHTLRQSDPVGREVLLAFENNDPELPIILDTMHSLLDEIVENREQVIEGGKPEDVLIDGKRITFDAQEEIVLRCGKSNITLTKAGKVLIRGAYLLSRSSGVNRIKGGSVQIN
jgi:hypothetical protein